MLALNQHQNDLTKAKRSQSQILALTSLQEVRASFGDLAITAAERVIRSSLDRQAHEGLINQVLEEGESLRRG